MSKEKTKNPLLLAAMAILSGSVRAVPYIKKTPKSARPGYIKHLVGK